MGDLLKGLDDSFGKDVRLGRFLVDVIPLLQGENEGIVRIVGKDQFLLVLWIVEGAKEFDKLFVLLV